MLGLLIWLVIGGGIGWLAIVVMRADQQHDILLNILAGIVGAYVGGALLAPVIGTTRQGSYFSAACMAVVFIGLVRLVRAVSPR